MRTLSSRARSTTLSFNRTPQARASYPRLLGRGRARLRLAVKRSGAQALEAVFV